MANNGVIGNAVIEVTVDASRIKSGMDSAATSARTQAAKIASGSEQVGASAKKQLSDFTGGVARFGAVIGTFVTFLKVGQHIREMLKDGTDRAREFVDALDVRNAADALSKVNAEIAQIEGRIDYATRTTDGYVYNLMFGDTPDKMQRQVNELRKTANVLQQFENARTRSGKDKDAKDRKDAELKASKDLRESAQKDADAALLENLSGVERVAEEEQRFFEEIEEKRKKSQDLEYQQALGRYSIAKQIYFIDQRRTIEAEKQAKIDAEKNKAAEESLRRQQDIANAINGIKQSSIDRTAGLVTSIDNLNQIAARIEQGVRGLR